MAAANLICQCQTLKFLRTVVILMHKHNQFDFYFIVFSAYERLKPVIQLEEGDKQFPSHLLKKVITSYAPMPMRGTKTRAVSGRF